MAEVGSREQFGALRKVLQPGEPAVCLPEAGGRRSGSCPTPRLPCEPGKGLGGPARPAEGVERLTLRGVYTERGARKGLGREVTWNQLNSCTCLVLTFESSPRCPAFFYPGQP